MSLQQLDHESRKEFEAEIQGWLRYEAATAALRSQYHHLDIVKMRWVLRYKESCKPKARLVIIGYHDPRVGSDVRTEAPVASRRGRRLFFMATAHNQFSIEMGDVKNAFLQGTFDDTTDGELAAEPVPELRKALNLREDESRCAHESVVRLDRRTKTLVEIACLVYATVGLAQLST